MVATETAQNLMEGPGGQREPKVGHMEDTSVLKPVTDSGKRSFQCLTLQNSSKEGTEPTTNNNFK